MFQLKVGGARKLSTFQLAITLLTLNNYHQTTILHPHLSCQISNRQVRTFDNALTSSLTNDHSPKKLKKIKRGILKQIKNSYGFNSDLHYLLYKMRFSEACTHKSVRRQVPLSLRSLHLWENYNIGWPGGNVSTCSVERTAATETPSKLHSALHINPLQVNFSKTATPAA